MTFASPADMAGLLGYHPSHAALAESFDHITRAAANGRAVVLRSRGGVEYRGEPCH